MADLSTQEMARQAAKIITQYAEEDTRQKRTLSPLTVVGYVFGALIGIAILCVATTAILNMF
jgi:hypothetical protein